MQISHFVWCDCTRERSPEVTRNTTDDTIILFLEETSHEAGAADSSPAFNVSVCPNVKKKELKLSGGC